MERYIIIKTNFPAVHHWPDCSLPDQYYLKVPHRHQFHVIMKWKVDHNDRDIEFINMKEQVESHIRQKYWNKFLGTKSCEDIAEALLTEFQASAVSVLEDNENGGEVYAN